jgi:hypothetical protein
MRKSSSRARLASAAALATGAVGAAVLVAPQAAFAATVSPAVVPIGGTVTITETTDTFTAGDASKVQLITGTVCNAKYTAPTTAILAVPSSTSALRTVTFVVPNTATANANQQIKKYIACVYDGNVAGTSNLQSPAAGYEVRVGVPPTINPAVGTTGGGETVTITPAANAAIFTGVTTIGTVFTTDTCPMAYGTPAAGTAATATKAVDGTATVAVPATVTSTAATPTKYNLCIYGGTAGTSALISSAQFGSSQLALSQTTGPWQGGNGLNVTSPNQFLAGIDEPGAVFMAAACDAKYEVTDTNDAIAHVPTANVRKLSNTRLAVTVPQLLQTAPGSQTTWNLCVYNGGVDETSDLIASNPYNITVVQSATGITPKAGPALGGSRIIVTGNAFPTEDGKITATLGGTPLKDIKPISATAFEAVTPQHAPANNVALVVSTTAGQHILSNAYSYTSALKVSPNTAPNTRAVDLIVNGVGFQSANFNTGNLLTGAHFYLVNGTYNGSAISTDRANAPVADCTNVLVLNDTEAICNINLTARLEPDGEAVQAAPTPAAAAALGIDTTAGSRVITGAASTFSSADVGVTIAETGAVNVPAGTTIVAVIDDETALISTNATGTATDISGQLLSPTARTTTITTSGTNTVATITGTGFTQADVGRFVISPRVPVGTTILSVQSATGATLSANASTAGTDPATLLTAALPVPEGAYNLTYVSNGALGASGSDANYVQSLVSSGSTFTVSSF